MSGNKRAANMYKGGRTFAARPRDMYFSLNKKLRLFGLKSMLSYK
ncbi:50S ribosomal protein L4, partial [Niveispirillum sp.]|nr:50S ribosomal protein L4 [Niveispirillum sp.]